MPSIVETRRLEELSLNALPALESKLHDGWFLRAAGGYTGRANSAAPLYQGSLEPAERISFAEGWYRERNLTPMIRLTEAAQPADLDVLLDVRGYTRRDDVVSVQVRSLRGDDIPGETVEVSEAPVPESWLAALGRFQPRVEHHFNAVRRLFSLLPSTSAFAMIRHGTESVAIGRAVLESSHLGLFDVFTNLELRRRGLATEVTLALLEWGTRNGASEAYLQVIPTNDSAYRLYRQLGFRETYRYWYRVAPRDLGSGKFVGHPLVQQ